MSPTEAESSANCTAKISGDEVVKTICREGPEGEREHHVQNRAIEKQRSRDRTKLGELVTYREWRQFGRD